MTQVCSSVRAYFSERATRIELALSAWEAEVLPLNYARVARQLYLGRAALLPVLRLPAIGRRRGCRTTDQAASRRISSMWVSVWCSRSVASTFARTVGTPPANDRCTSNAQSTGSPHAG